MTVRTTTNRRLATLGSWEADLRAAVPGWLMARVALVGALVLTRVIELFQADHGTGWQTIGRWGLLSWDANWYQRIAVHGYAALPQESLRFFPLYPLLGRILGAGTWVGTGIALAAHRERRGPDCRRLPAPLLAHQRRRSRHRPADRRLLQLRPAGLRARDGVHGGHRHHVGADLHARPAPGPSGRRHRRRGGRRPRPPDRHRPRRAGPGRLVRRRAGRAMAPRLARARRPGRRRRRTGRRHGDLPVVVPDRHGHVGDPLRRPDHVATAGPHRRPGEHGRGRLRGVRAGCTSRPPATRSPWSSPRC